MKNENKKINTQVEKEVEVADENLGDVLGGLTKAKLWEVQICKKCGKKFSDHIIRDLCPSCGHRKPR